MPTSDWLQKSEHAKMMMEISIRDWWLIRRRDSAQCRDRTDLDVMNIVPYVRKMQEVIHDGLSANFMQFKVR
jgi:hypothetical protein